MNAFIEAVPWCLWGIVFWKLLPRFDRLLGLAERGMALWEKGAFKGLPTQLKNLISGK